MNWELSHRFVDTLAWPAIFLIAFFLFRRQVVSLLDRMSKLSFGDVSLELRDKVESLEAHAKNVEYQKQADDQAVAMADVQLSETLEPPFDAASLVASIKKASPGALDTIYKQAKQVRRSAWQSLQQRRAASFPSDREKERAIAQSVRWMQRTIPIFQGLTELEHRARWHRYYAQLGYALKDTGDLHAARDALAQAIEQWKIQTGTPVSPHYRFNWVYCETRIDNEGHSDGASSDSQTLAEVKTALEEGSNFPALAEALKSDPEIARWLRRNQLDWSWVTQPVPQ